jgi:ABC-type nitrate/sulfonate/bicarbonate transport system substrate-binding protein
MMHFRIPSQAVAPARPGRCLLDRGSRIVAWAATRPRLAVWMLVLLTLGGCNDDSPGPALRVAVNPWPGYSFVYLAEEKGYFQEEGVSVRLIELASLADGRRVFEQGQADVMCCTLVEVLSTNESSGEDPAQIISAVDYSDGSDMLLACPDVKSLEAIRGCRIGVEPESVDGLSVFLALSSIGLTMEDVTLVALAQSEMIDAIRTERWTRSRLIHHCPMKSSVSRERIGFGTLPRHLAQSLTFWQRIRAC